MAMVVVVVRISTKSSSSALRLTGQLPIWHNEIFSLPKNGTRLNVTTQLFILRDQGKENDKQYMGINTLDQLWGIRVNTSRSRLPKHGGGEARQIEHESGQHKEARPSYIDEKRCG